MHNLWYHYVLEIGPTAGPFTVLAHVPTRAQALQERQHLLARAGGNLEIAAALRVRRVGGMHRRTALQAVGGMVFLTMIAVLGHASPVIVHGLIGGIIVGVLGALRLPGSRLRLPTLRDSPTIDMD